MKKIIVKQNDSYIVLELEEGESIPPNFVLGYPPFNSRNGVSYKLPKSEFDIYWSYGSNQGNKLSFKHKGTLINQLKKPVLQSVVDFIIKYENMNEADLKELIKNANENLKSELEIDIENLKTKKEELEEEISKLKKIVRIKDELFKLVSELTIAK